MLTDFASTLGQGATSCPACDDDGGPCQVCHRVDPSQRAKEMISALTGCAAMMQSREVDNEIIHEWATAKSELSRYVADLESRLAAAEARAVRCEGVVRDAAYLMSRRLEGAAMIDSYLAAYRVLFSHLHPEDGDAASS